MRKIKKAAIASLVCAVLSTSSMLSIHAAIIGVDLNDASGNSLPVAMKISVGDKVKITSTIATDDVDDISSEWSQAGSTVGVIKKNEAGGASLAENEIFVTGKSEGVSTVLVTSVADPTQSKGVDVEVYKLPTLSSVTATNDTISLNKGQTATAKITHNGKVDNSVVEYLSDDTSIATVDVDGVITAKGIGSTTVTVTVTETNEAGAVESIDKVINVSVIDPNSLPSLDFVGVEVDGELVDQINTTANKTFKLDVTTNKLATTSTITKTFTSDNTSVAKVNVQGSVSSLKPGIANITITVKEKTKEGTEQTLTKVITVAVGNGIKTSFKDANNQSIDSFNLEPNTVISTTLSLEGGGSISGYTIKVAIEGSQSDAMKFLSKANNTYYFKTTGKMMDKIENSQGGKIVITATNNKDSSDIIVKEIPFNVGYEVSESGPIITREFLKDIQSANSGTGIKFPVKYSHEGISFEMEQVTAPKDINVSFGTIDSDVTDMFSSSSYVTIPFMYSQTLPGKTKVILDADSSWLLPKTKPIYLYSVDGDKVKQLQELTIDKNRQVVFYITSTARFIVSDLQLNAENSSSTSSSSSNNSSSSSSSSSTPNKNPNTGVVSPLAAMALTLLTAAGAVKLKSKKK